MPGHPHKKRKTDHQSQSWSDLPVDILTTLMDRLCFSDQVRCQAVCRQWRSVHGVRYADKLPWLSVYRERTTKNGSTTGVCELYDTSLQRKYVVENPALGKNKIPDKARFWDSKRGWVLFSVKEEFKRTVSFLLYSPFTNETIEIPEFQIMKGLDFKFHALMSATPSSPCCLIFVLIINHDSNNLCISTISPKEQTWRSLWLDGYYGEVRDVVCMEGILYCLFSLNVMGVFNPALQDWTIHACPVLPERSYCKLIESDGNLLMALNGFSQCRMLRLDRSEMKWEEEKGLANRVLFIGSSSISVPATGEASELANTIHFDGIAVLCKSYVDDQTAKTCRCPQVFDWIDHSWLTKFWIQPPLSSAL